jgi:hypothetical protein
LKLKKKKKEEMLYRKIALRLTYQSPGADVRNCRGILEAEKNAKGCFQ